MLSKGLRVFITSHIFGQDLPWPMYNDALSAILKFHMKISSQVRLGILCWLAMEANFMATR